VSFVTSSEKLIHTVNQQHPNHDRCNPVSLVAIVTTWVGLVRCVASMPVLGVCLGD